MNRNKSYRAQWIIVIILALAGWWWIMEGRAYVRRTRYAAQPIRESSRTESQYLALLFPRVSMSRDRMAMSARDFKTVIAHLQRSGYVSLNLKDLEDFYFKGRLLPPKSVLITFDKDYPPSVKTVDSVLKKYRMRGILFMEGIASSGSLDERRFLSPHAVKQMMKGKAWDLGWISSENPPENTVAGKLSAVIDTDGLRPAPKKKDSYPFQFKAMEWGHNDYRDNPRSIHLMRLRPGLSAEDTVNIIEGAWPRKEEFVDDFKSGVLGTDWIAGWGSVSPWHDRMALIPLPRHTGAGVALRGTEKWRDMVVEFDLNKYHKEFWVYTRFRQDGRYLRIGIKDGVWYVEQKVSSEKLPNTLGRAISYETFPAHVRLVLKDDWVILHINGKMQFGKALKVSPRVDYGRVEFGVYDRRPKSALAFITYVRAKPIAEEWVTWKEGIPGAFEEGRLERLREEAVYARTISPRWIYMKDDGTVYTAGENRDFVSSLAGFYRCNLVPMAQLPPYWTSLLKDSTVSKRLMEGLVRASADLDSPGLNLYLRKTDSEEPEVIRFLSGLRKSFRSQGRKLWVTVASTERVPAAVAQAVDGILKPAQRAVPGLQLLAGQ